MQNRGSNGKGLGVTEGDFLKIRPLRINFRALAIMITKQNRGSNGKDSGVAQNCNICIGYRPDVADEKSTTNKHTTRTRKTRRAKRAAWLSARHGPSYAEEIIEMIAIWGFVRGSKYLD